MASVPVRLHWRQIERLKKMVGGSTPSRKARRAQVLLMLHDGHGRDAIASALRVGVATIGRTKRRFLEEGLEAALEEKARSGRPPKVTERDKKNIVALCCGPPPQGHPRWTLKLLAEHAPTREPLSLWSIRLILEQDGMKPWREKNVVRSDAGRRVHHTDE